MKICYIYLSSYSAVKSGVDNKVIGKCHELLKMFPGSKFVRFTPQKANTDDFFESIQVNSPTKKYFKNSYYNKALFESVDDMITKDKNTFDFYIVRYPFASKALLNLLQSHPHKIIFEHNTNERKEKEVIVNANKKKIPFSLRPSVLAYYKESILRANSLERKLGAKCLELAAGGIAVTPEIEKLEKIIYPSYKTVVITNGIVPDSKPLKSRSKDFSLLNGVFLAGTNAEWNGIERIAESFNASQIQDKMKLYFVGRIDDSLKKKYSSPSIHFVEYMSKEELVDFLSKMHFAIGTCAIHKKGLMQGAVLKVREYLISGLPTVLGHSDPYIENIPELNKYCTHFLADDSYIDFNTIYSRLKEMYSDNEINTKIQNLACKYLSWEEVLKPLPSFLNTLKQQ